MHVRRIFTVYALTLGVCLLFIANQAEPQATRGGRGDDGSMRILARPDAAEDPSAVTVATPKGRRRVEPADLGHYDIPVTALMAYQRAADILVEVKPSCGLTWTLLAAIGRVESDHGRYAGATLGADGVPTPQVVGVPLDGQGPVAEIRDTDGGRWDNDPRWDHAVGPMQFIPATWSVVGVDGDGDGVRSVDDIDDAALAAGIYLCAGSDDLRERSGMEAALYRYNDSRTYVALVLAYEKKYRGGDFDVVTPDGGVAVASAALASHPLSGTPIETGTRAEARLKARIKADARAAVAAAKETDGKTRGISGTTPTKTRKVLSQDDSTKDSPSSKPSPRASDDSSSDSSSDPDASGSSGSPSDGGSNGPAPSDAGGSGTADPGTGASDAPADADQSGSTSPSPTEDPTCTATPEPSSEISPTESPDPQPCDAEATDPTNAEATCEAPCEPTPSP